MRKLRLDKEKPFCFDDLSCHIAHTCAELHMSSCSHSGPRLHPRTHTGLHLPQPDTCALTCGAAHIHTYIHAWEHACPCGLHAHISPCVHRLHTFAHTPKSGQRADKGAKVQPLPPPCTLKSLSTAYRHVQDWVGHGQEALDSKGRDDLALKTQGHPPTSKQGYRGYKALLARQTPSQRA